MTKVKFTKMHGNGNDFVLINALKLRPEILKRLKRHIKFISDRRLGIGADQILLVLRSKEANFQMSIFNADGSNAEMCGNGIRCFLKYIHEKKISTKRKITVSTKGGIVTPRMIGKLIEVDMGEPILSCRKIPVNWDGELINRPLSFKDIKFFISCVSMGNPHCIIFVNNVSLFPVSQYGPIIENHNLFPLKTNVEFIEVIDHNHIRMRVWERGVGETPACGSGACAAVVAAHLNKKTKRKVKVEVNGGILKINWDKKNNHVFMTGPAETVYDGEIKI